MKLQCLWFTHTHFEHVRFTQQTFWNVAATRCECDNGSKEILFAFSLFTIFVWSYRWRLGVYWFFVDFELSALCLRQQQPFLPCSRCAVTIPIAPVYAYIHISIEIYLHNKCNKIKFQSQNAVYWCQSFLFRKGAS